MSVRVSAHARAQCAAGHQEDRVRLGDRPRALQRPGPAGREGPQERLRHQSAAARRGTLQYAGSRPVPASACPREGGWAQPGVRQVPSARAHPVFLGLRPLCPRPAWAHLHVDLSLTARCPRPRCGCPPVSVCPSLSWWLFRGLGAAFLWCCRLSFPRRRLGETKKRSFRVFESAPLLSLSYAPAAPKQLSSDSHLPLRPRLSPPRCPALPVGPWSPPAKHAAGCARDPRVREEPRPRSNPASRVCVSCD